MSELKAYLCIQAREIENKTFSCYNQTLAVKNAPEATMAQVYLKDEADNVIDELKQKINEAQTELELWRDGSIISETHQKELDEKRHSDYKRCLAMVRWCDEVMMSCELRGYAVHRIWANKHQWAMRWKYKWLENAKQFKEYENGLG